MIMTSLETMTNVITNSNVSKITAAITLQIMFDKGRCHGDILRKQVNIICHVDRIFGNTRNIDFNRADYTWLSPLCYIASIRNEEQGTGFMNDKDTF